MRHRTAFRATAGLLAALFLGGAGGASDVDALLFHRGASVVAAGVSHVESAGESACHTDRCVLALRLANGRVARTLSVPVRFEAIPVLGAASRPDVAPSRFLPGLHLQSRAPPTPLT